MIQPLCFVMMPFGTKPDAAGVPVQFDRIYREIVEPAIAEAGMRALRADEELAGGFLQKSLFERLMLCDFAIADLTTGDASVFYELGIRHAVRRHTTVLIHAENSRLPIDVGPLRPVRYKVGPTGAPEEIRHLVKTLAARLRNDGMSIADSPVYQTVDPMRPGPLAADALFLGYSASVSHFRERLSAARLNGVDAVRRIENEIGDLWHADSALVTDLFLSYRAVSAYSDMIDLVSRMPKPLAETIMVQEQLGLALNRMKRRDEAENVLLALIRRRGPSSETYGILGRVYKDQWTEAFKSGKSFLARDLLEKAIEAYMRGFEIDPRDPYPGVNAATLSELRDPPDPRGKEILPVVRFALRRRMAMGHPDYWDFATLLELAVLADDESAAMEALRSCIAAVREVWMPETTANNIRMMRQGRERRGQAQPWIQEVEEALSNGVSA